MVRNKLANANRVWGTGPRTLAPLDGRNVCMDSTVPGRSLWRRVAAGLGAVEPAVCRRWPAAERAPRGAGRAAATGRCSVGCQRSPPTRHPRAARTARTAPCGAPRGTTATLRRQRDGQTRRQMYGHSETVNRDGKRTGTASRSTETQMYGHGGTVNRDGKRTDTASRSTETANVEERDDDVSNGTILSLANGAVKLTVEVNQLGL